METYTSEGVGIGVWGVGDTKMKAGGLVKTTALSFHKVINPADLEKS